MTRRPERGARRRECTSPAVTWSHGPTRSRSISPACPPRLAPAGLWPGWLPAREGSGRTRRCASTRMGLCGRSGGRLPPWGQAVTRWNGWTRTRWRPSCGAATTRRNESACQWYHRDPNRHPQHLLRRRRSARCTTRCHRRASIIAPRIPRCRVLSHTRRRWHREISRSFDGSPTRATFR